MNKHQTEFLHAEVLSGPAVFAHSGLYRCHCQLERSSSEHNDCDYEMWVWGSNWLQSFKLFSAFRHVWHILIFFIYYKRTYSIAHCILWYKPTQTGILTYVNPLFYNAICSTEYMYSPNKQFETYTTKIPRNAVEK